MIDDPIVEDIHAAREKIWAECDANWENVIKRWRKMASSRSTPGLNVEDVRKMTEAGQNQKQTCRMP